MLLILLRGIPGAGKSTYAMRVLTGARIVSPDAIMEREQGGYHWTADAWQSATDQADRELVGAIRAKHPLVVSDRCNITTHAWGGVVGFARAMGYRVEIHQLEVDELTAVKRNVHGVTLELIRTMWRRMDGTRLPEDIPVHVVTLDG